MPLWRYTSAPRPASAIIRSELSTNCWSIFTSCSALPVLENLPFTNEALGILIDLLNAPRQTQVCPNNPIAPTASSAKDKKAATP